MTGFNVTIDITDTVEATRKAFVDWGTAYVFGLEVAIPGMEWVALPVISELDKVIVREILNLLSSSVIMQAFFINTALRKASQASDLIAAVDAKNSLPATATLGEFENAEKAQMAAFRDFVCVTT